VDRRTDLYALGCVFYEVLCLYPAFEGENVELLGRVRAGEFPDVATRNPRRHVPEDLADLCRWAMATQAKERPGTAGEFAGRLRGWLDGSAEAGRRHREAEELAARGREAVTRFEALKEEVAEAEKAVHAESAKVQPWEPLEQKAAARAARRRVEDLSEELATALAETTKFLEGALLCEPRNATAREALADLWAGRLADAERRRDRQDTAHALRMVQRYDDGRLARLIEGTGTLELQSDPPGAEVVLQRFEDREGILEVAEERSLGKTPVGPVDLPMGSYLFLLRLDGFREVRYPVHVTRNRECRGTVRMRTDGEIGEGFVCVPEGPFAYGEGKDAETRDLPDFAIAEYPVTFGEWAEYLAWLDREQGPEAAAKRAPKPRGEDFLMERLKDGAYRPLPVLVEGEARERYEREYGEGFEARIPVLGVSWNDAVAYCEWRTRTTGREHRLPTEEEREKAARGVDGRGFPWGDLEDATLAKCEGSRNERSQPEPVGAFRTARSVYGMGDAAGGIWDWTDSWFDERRSVRVLRGGAWNLPPKILRCAIRNTSAPDGRSVNLGFRCARDLP
jgi:serine/threonine-protein kinase